VHAWTPVVWQCLFVQVVAAGMTRADENRQPFLFYSLVKAEPAIPVNIRPAADRRFGACLPVDFAVNIRF